MNLPTIIDIAISLIFVYLILSLLASEIQELLATLLQWRAVHLKESIEGLLSGDSQGEELTKVRQLSNQIYENPLVKGLNQEAKGFLATLPRKFSRIIGSIFRFGRQNIFGQNNSGPSFMSSQVFASSLLDTLKIPELTHKITALNMRILLREKLLNKIGNILEEYDNSINRFNLSFKNQNELNKYLKYLGIAEDEASQHRSEILIDFYKLINNLNKVILFFDNKQADLVITVDKIAEDLDEYIQKCQNYLPEYQITQLKSLQEETLGNTPKDRVYLLRELQPNISELLNIIWEAKEISARWQTYQNQKQVVEKEALIAAAQEANQKTQAIIDELQQSTEASQSDDTSGEIKNIYNEIGVILTSNTSTYDYDQLINVINNLADSQDTVKVSLTDNINQINYSYQTSIQDESDRLYNNFRQEVESEEDEQFSSTSKRVLIILAFLDNLHQVKEINHLEQKIAQLLALHLPEATRQNLVLLAEKTQTKFEDVKEDLTKFEQEVSSWFNRSMERASGVYKRNAKLVAIIIGFIVALAANADTLHMFNMLSKDEALRAVIAQTANDIAVRNSELTPQAIEEINQATETLTLPIGWGEVNRKNQSKNRKGLLNIRYIFGWLITAIAISMGSSFWYDLLGKIVDVGNVGKKPQPSNDSQNSNNS
ncbi:hypothetical protein [Limnofasciculus baicalensis]|uniref:Uncharacterized protein n=1 Tax=Limnofasciculus baicalensis BBK-W-15 TaxID=2699891 RepID=A0AAE3GQM7_9CYAN|nr:hypothetical protein [Limnofasciculus baicalensis]MCP2728409.1 hypothetical protein [Limnofasciculus baicalensis BBK-W-15]